MELHRLRYLLAVADEGSLTAAARTLQIAQSGVSSQLSKLERELGVALFQRAGRGVVLTTEGKSLLPTVRAAVHAVDSVSAAASDLRGLVVGSLSVGTVTTLMWPRLFDAIGDLHAAHPGVVLRLSEGTSQQLLGEVRRGELDVAIAAWAEDEPLDLDGFVVFDDPLVAVVSPDHPWASRSSIRPAEFAQTDVIAFGRGTGSREALEDMMRRARRPIVPRWEVAGPSFMEALAQRGLGVGIVSETTASGWGLRCIPVADADARSRLGVVWRPAPNAASRAFVQRLRDGVLS